MDIDFQYSGWSKVRTGVILYLEDSSATKCIVDKIQTGSVGFRSIVGMKTVDARAGWLAVLTACM